MASRPPTSLDLVFKMEDGTKRKQNKRFTRKQVSRLKAFIEQNPDRPPTKEEVNELATELGDQPKRVKKYIYNFQSRGRVLARQQVSAEKPSAVCDRGSDLSDGALAGSGYKRPREEDEEVLPEQPPSKAALPSPAEILTGCFGQNADEEWRREVLRRALKRVGLFASPSQQQLLESNNLLLMENSSGHSKN